jgi:hypothetical protein
MIPIASGMTPAPKPCTTLPATMSASDPASAEISVPAASAASAITSRRFLPNMSPRRPQIGVATDALRRNAVRIQLASVVEVCRSSWMSRKAGATRDCCMATAMLPSASTANVIP